MKEKEIMMPKDMAKELIIKFYSKMSGLSIVYISKNWKYLGKLSLDSNFKTAIDCALIAVEIAVTDLAFVIPKEAFNFWEQAKLELKKFVV